MRFVFIVSIISCFVVSISCRTAIRRSRRDVSIINPNYTDITNYPYTVAVLKDNELLGGGVLVKARWVLTAAYNTNGFRPEDLKVRIGSNTPHQGGHTYRVSRIVEHPSFSGDWTNDLSMLKLRGAVQPTAGTPVGAIAKAPFQANAIATVTGYGATTMNTMAENTGMQTINITLFDTNTCDKDWYGSELTSGELCGFSPGVGPCWADFGDPVVVCGSAGGCTLVGIFAGSYGCADDHFPGIYTDIGFFYNWINSNGRRL